ncbi:MAG: hypothetical protein M1834_006598 [Cirrosporium novae-zelandiae]|nr:MAG: hypothetical protein M1834_006598 [Cirrosporium novae-zelandiae]
MAPPIKSREPSPSAPLADYFWIAGLDGSEILEAFKSTEPENPPLSPLPIAQTIQEDVAEEAEQEEEKEDEGQRTPTSEKRHSFLRLSKVSDDLRLSLQSFSDSFGESFGESSTSKGRASNRSSRTIKAGGDNGSKTPDLNDVDFDKALRDFASGRDRFFSTDLSLAPENNAIPNRPKPRPKTQKIVSEEVPATPTLQRGIGSIRRLTSFRDTNSMRRQPSVARHPSVRTSRRMSNYNSVIPTPQPLKPSPKEHPLKRRFEPVLLDRYPPRHMVEEAKRRGPFPDYVPMFAFPNDINIISSDERPRSTWHGFAMTAADNAKIYGICVIMWIPLGQEAAEALEKRCEEWRRDNMTDEERELAASLGERLAIERAKLSRLLAQLPSMPSGLQRENFEDEISAVEEKIGLMTDLLRPVRHGASSKIEGLTDGDTGLWIPRAFGILGKDAGLTSFWKEWLRAVVVPMTSGGILRVAPSSPRIGMWQPLERYVVNLCMEALSPMSSKTQVEISIRELRLIARKEAINELPGSRNTDIWALFRALSIPNIVVLFEFALAESRIILLSSYPAMLHLASQALVHLLYPLTWAGVFIPILPVRLIQALEAPCPYIVGILRQYENIELPEDDFVLVDLDQDEIESTIKPAPMPRHPRRKLTSLLQMAAPHHLRYGIQPGPPAYAMESYPYNAFDSEATSVYTQNAPPSTLAKYVNLNSNSFGENGVTGAHRTPIFNAFLLHRTWSERPSTSSTVKTNTPPSPRISPTSSTFPPLPSTPGSRNDSGFALQSSLREKRSGYFDSQSRKGSLPFDRIPTVRRPSGAFTGHSSNLSVSTLGYDGSMSTYAPSTYAQSTLAASTIVGQVPMQQVHNTDTMSWVEGHCVIWRPRDQTTVCVICDEKGDDGIYKCNGCGIGVHGRCLTNVSLVCPVAFHADQVRAAFVRCFASLFYTYRKHLMPAVGDQKKSGLLYTLDMNGFLRGLPTENANYISMLQQTQAFNEFIHTRESLPPNHSSIILFDQIILSKRNRGRTSLFSKSSTNFLSDISDHLWRSAAAVPPHSRFPGDYRTVVSRVPAKLDPNLIKEPRMIAGVPRLQTANAKRKPVAQNGHTPNSSS